MSSSKKNRITVKIKRPNPLFENWLEEWQKEAAENGLKSQYTFGKALTSLRKYPLLLESGKECIILDGFGKQLCAALDNKLNEYKKCKPHLLLSNNENITINEIGKKQKPKRKSKVVEKNDELRTNYSEENAVLITLLIESQKKNYRGYMLRDEIIDLSKQFCDKLLVESNSNNTISFVLEKLTFDGLVHDILGQYSLTDQGISVASKLYTENGNLSEDKNLTEKDNVKNKRKHSDVEKQTPSKGKKKLNTSKTKQYVPTWRSGGYAILIALYEESKTENYAGYMLKNEIINRAKHHCDKSFTKPDPGSFYTAWSSMSTLISKGLVSRKSSPAKFSLTNEGTDIASRLCNATTANDSDKNELEEEDFNGSGNKHLTINVDLEDAIENVDVNESFRSPSRNERMDLCKQLDVSTEVNINNDQKILIDNQKSAILVLLFKESQKEYYRGYTFEQEIITLLESCDNIDSSLESLINEGLVSIENLPSCYSLTDEGMDAAINFYYNEKSSMERLKEQDLNTNNADYKIPGYVTDVAISRTKNIDDLIQKYGKNNASQTYSTVISSDGKKEMEICVINSDNENDKEMLKSKRYSDSDEDFLCTPSVIKKTNEMLSCNNPSFSDCSANLNLDKITGNVASSDDEIGTCILSTRNQTHVEQIIDNDRGDFNSIYGDGVPSNSKSNPKSVALSSDTDELNLDLICKRKKALKENSKIRSRKKLKEKISSSDSDGDINNICKKSKMTKKQDLLRCTHKEIISSSDSEDNLIYKEKRIALQDLKKHAHAYQESSDSNEDDASYGTGLYVPSKSKQSNEEKVSSDEKIDCGSLYRNDKNFTDTKYDLEKEKINYDTSKFPEVDRYSALNKNKFDKNYENSFRDDFNENIPVPSTSKNIFKPKIPVMKSLSQHGNSEPLPVFKLDNQCTQTSVSDTESDVIFYPRTFEIILLVDTQETSGRNGKNDVTVSELEHMKVKFEVCRLNVGDFAWICRNQLGQELILPYIVERKRMDDLGHSIKDGRYHEQKFRMKQSGLQNLIYLIESHGNNQHTGLPITSLYQAAINTDVQDCFTVKYTSCHRNSMEYVARLTRFLIKLYKDKTLHGCVKLSLTESSPKEKIARLLLFSEFNAGAKKGKNTTVHQLFIRQLIQLKGVSVDKAAAITEKYPTPAVLYETYKSKTSKEGEKLLSSIKSQNRCIGPIISKAIYKFYTENEF